MRALVLKDHWTLAVEQVADSLPGPDEILIDVVATGICGSDFHGFSGENGRRFPGQIMGHETVGRVAAVGSQVHQDLPIGTVVTVNPVIGCGHCPACEVHEQTACPDKRVIGVDPTFPAAFAEQMIAPAANAVPLPPSMPIEYGALVEPLAVGYHALNRGRCRPGDTVLVIGGGPIGQACALAARRLGVTAVAVSETSPDRRALIDGIGVTAVDPTATDDLAGAVRAVLGGPPNLVVDAVGLPATLASAFGCASFGATIVLVGMGSPELPLPAFEVSTKERTVVGSFCYSEAEFTATASWVGSAPPELAGLIDGRIGMDGAQQAFTDLARGISRASKILVLFDEPAPA